MGAFQTYFVDILTKKYCQFNGRARRKEYWMFALFYAIISIILNIISFALIFTAGPDSIVVTIMTVVIALFGFGILLPMLGLYIRRLHDIGKSGWWLLLGIVPLANIALFVFAVMDSQPGPNKYGPNPKGLEGNVASDVFV